MWLQPHLPKGLIMGAELQQRLNQLCGELLASGDELDAEACRFIQSAIAAKLEAGKRRHRMRQVRLRNSAGKDRGGFRISQEALSRAEILDDG